MSQTTTTMPTCASRWAGKCKRCQGEIAVGETICKVDDRWVCARCATIPPASTIDAPPTPHPTPPVTADPSAPTAPPPPQGRELVESLHARIWRFAVVEAGRVPDADPREKRITALAFYKALMAAEISRGA